MNEEKNGTIWIPTLVLGLLILVGMAVWALG